MEPNAPMENTSPQMGDTQKSNGALVGSIIVIIIIVLGGVYLWMQSKPKEAPVSNTLVEQNSIEGSLDLQIPGGDSGETLD